MPQNFNKKNLFVPAYLSVFKGSGKKWVKVNQGCAGLVKKFSVY